MATWSSANNAAVLTERQALLDARLAEADGGYLRLYNSSNTVIAELALGTPAFGAANGSCLATANAITPDAAPTVGGVIDHAKIVTSGGTDVLSLTAGLSGTEVIVAGGTLTIPASTSITASSVTVQG